MLLEEDQPVRRSMPRSVSSDAALPWSGGLVERRMGWVGSAVPLEPASTVLDCVKPPKSGLGERLLPVSGACEMPKPPRMTTPIVLEVHTEELHLRLPREAEARLDARCNQRA